MTLVLSAAAETDLIDIYIEGARRFGITQAERYLDRLEKMIQLIGDTPRIARERPEITPPVRVHPIAAHLIIYLIEESGRVRILRIRHHREDWTTNPVAADR